MTDGTNNFWSAYLENRAKLYAQWKQAVRDGDLATARTVREQILLHDAPLLDPGPGPSLDIIHALQMKARDDRDWAIA
jgi:hypothetical protein